MKEVLIYTGIIIVSVLFTLTLFGGFDTDEENPWKNN
jgi:preprotein translocase subunit SecE